MPTLYLEDFEPGAVYRAGSVQLSEDEILEFGRPPTP
jgi:hypothetical protein